MKFQVLKYAVDIFAAVPAMVAGCVPPLRSRPNAGGPQIGEVLVTGVGGGSANADIYSGRLQFPARFLMLTGVSSVGNAFNLPFLSTRAFNALVHFRKMNNQYGASGTVNLVTNKTMPWFQLGGTFIGAWLMVEPGSEFQDFYVDCDGSGAAPQLNFIYSNAITNYWQPTQLP